MIRKVGIETQTASSNHLFINVPDCFVYYYQIFAKRKCFAEYFRHNQINSLFCFREFAFSVIINTPGKPDTITNIHIRNINP